MNSTVSTYFFRILLCMSLLLPFSVSADIVYPARLELNEVEPGVFDVYFVLPVIQGKVLKAAPVFPDFCSMLSEPQITGTMYVKETRWRIQCEPQQLYGQNIGISGLLGSQVTIILVVTTLEGRTYNANLNPASAWFEIPPPPSGISLLSDGLIKGSRIPVTNFIFVLLLFILILTGDLPARKIMTITILGIMTGYLLTYFEWLRIPGWLFEISALLLGFIIILKGYLTKIFHFSSDDLLTPLFLSLVFLGAEQLQGALTPGYTEGESAILLLFTLTGIVLGVGLLYLLIRQGLLLMHLLTPQTSIPRATLTSISGIISLGLLIFYASLLWGTPSLFPPVPPVLWLVTLIVITALSIATKSTNRTLLLSFLTPCLLGVGLGFFGLVIPYNSEIILGMGFVLLIPQLFGVFKTSVIPQIILILVGLGTGIFLAGYADTNLSYPVARTLEFIAIVIYTTGLLLPFLSGSKKIASKKLTGMSAQMVFTVIIVIFSSIFFISKAGITFKNITVEPELELSVLSILLLLGGLIFWPKIKKVHKDMGLNSRKPIASLVMLVLAFCFLPLKSNIKNPWFNADNMDLQRAQNVMEQILSNTYTAFNIEDEELLFETLSSNVDEELLDNIYLDSRRRLTMGLREGAEVTVEEVRVDLLGGPENNTPETAMSYPATWTVTARVKHLKHIHYRRNRYTGTIEMKTNNDSWKISKIILNSEEREVIPSATL